MGLDGGRPVVASTKFKGNRTSQMASLQTPANVVNVVRIRQQRNWDCGLACCQMVLAYVMARGQALSFCPCGRALRASPSRARHLTLNFFIPFSRGFAILT